MASADDYPPTFPTRAITLTEPWASLVVLNRKHYETRGWPTRFRDPIFVHAAKGMPRYAREAACVSPFVDDLAAALGAGTEAQILEALDERRGKIIGRCDITGCSRTEDVRDTLSEREVAYGDYSDGRFAFGLAHATPFSTHVACRGMLGIWSAPSDALQLLSRAA